MARHFCKFRKNFSAREYEGEIVGIGGQNAANAFFVIKSDNSFYSIDIDDCRPIKKPIAKKKK